MNTKYNNPKIELRNHAPDNLPIDPDLFEACYLTGENKILLSLKTQIPTQRHYVCSRISELAHAYQAQRDGLELFYKKELEDISSMEVQGKEYYDLYGTP